MVTVPVAETFPRFEWINEAGQVQPVHGPQSDPREITDYVIDSKDWPSKRASVRSVLTRNRFSLECEVALQCGNERDTCEGQYCVDYFQNVVTAAGKKMCDIRGAGAMGKGVFANQSIPDGFIIGEYLGRLHPLRSLPRDDRYIFVINGITEVSANEFGNFTRFVNHHCRANVTPRIGMYGKRQVILYEANRGIKPGEQLFVDYGTSYFSLPDYPCKCDAQDGDHLPGAVRFRSRGAAASEEAKARNARQKTRARRRDTDLNGTQTGVGIDEAIGATKSPKKTRGRLAKKQGVKQSTALNNLTRSAAICKRRCPRCCPKVSPSL